jgi:uncharacterized delta-60 repeat protein
LCYHLATTKSFDNGIKMQADSIVSLQKLALSVILLLLAPLAGVGIAKSAGSGLCLGTDGDVNVIVLQKDGKTLIGGLFTNVGGQPRNYIARLNADGSIDATFNPGANDVVNAIAIQADGKILVGGNFTTLGGQPRNSIGRLNEHGSLDTAFNPGATGPNGHLSPVHAVALQADGKILIGGNFTALNGQPRTGIARLNADGSLDTTFDLGVSGAYDSVLAVALQADGKILIGGRFTTLGGQQRFNLGRLNPDGSLDTAFNPDLINIEVETIALQPDGKILVGGNFQSLGGQPRNGIGRLNSDGSIDSAFNPGTNGFSPRVLTIVLQADGKILVGGNFQSLGGQRRTSLGRLNPDGSVDPAVNPFLANDASVAALALQADGEILVGGNFSVLGGSARNGLGRLLPNGSSDPNDCPDDRFSPALGGVVSTIAVQPDNKILVGTFFIAFGGQPGRLNEDGSLDAAFNPHTDPSIVRVIAVQPDSKILVGGDFGMLDGQVRNLIGRLNADGSLDTSFNASAIFPEPDFLSIPGNSSINVGPARSAFLSVLAIAVQADGKILAGGSFILGGNQTLRNFGRLNPDGSRDTTFNTDANSPVNAIAVQADGKILVGGGFTTFNGQPRTGIARLNADGSLDSTFNVGEPGIDAGLSAIALQPDGKILIGGSFTKVGAQSHKGIARLNADGSLDTSFNAGADGRLAKIYTMVVQSDGNILVGGLFTTLNGQPRANIGRLNPDGSLDAFDPGANMDVNASGIEAFVNAIGLQSDGTILVGGLFTTLNGQPRRYFGRLLNPTAAVQSLNVNSSGTKITWSCSGATPETVRATFEISTDGVNYTMLARGKRIQGGWKRGSLTLPKDRRFFIRARGYYAGSVVESVASFNQQQ